MVVPGAIARKFTGVDPGFSQGGRAACKKKQQQQQYAIIFVMKND